MSENPRPPLDKYEAEHIAAGATVIHRDKVVSRPIMFLFLAFALMMALITLANFSQSNVLGGLVGVLLTAGTLVLSLTRPVMRTVVTQDQLQVHWGLSGPKISLASIRGVQVRSGLRQHWTEANQEPGKPIVELILGPSGKSEMLEIEWTDETGKARRTWLGVDDPHALAGVLRMRATTGVRVAPTAEDITAVGVEAGENVEQPVSKGAEGQA